MLSCSPLSTKYPQQAWNVICNVLYPNPFNGEVWRPRAIAWYQQLLNRTWKGVVTLDIVHKNDEQRVIVVSDIHPKHDPNLSFVEECVRSGHMVRRNPTVVWDENALNPPSEFFWPAPETDLRVEEIVDDPEDPNVGPWDYEAELHSPLELAWEACHVDQRELKLKIRPDSIGYVVLDPQLEGKSQKAFCFQGK